MAKVTKLSNLAKLLLKFERTIDKELLTKIGSFVVDRIQTFTRLGKSIAGDRSVAMSPYSPAYKQLRKEAISKGKPVDPEWFRPGAGNAQLVFTGQMLRSMDHTTNVQNKSVTISPTGSRNDGETNKQIATHVSKTRPFVGLDKAGEQQIVRMIKKEIVSKLKKNR